MSQLRLYSVRECKDADWHLLVVERSSKRAKLRAIRHGLMEMTDINAWIQVSVKWLRQTIVPDTITEPMVFDICGGVWQCAHWDHHRDMCGVCERYNDE